MISESSISLAGLRLDSDDTVTSESTGLGTNFSKTVDSPANVTVSEASVVEACQ